MAAEEDINQVLINIPDEYTEYGWNSDKIEELLNAGLSTTKVTLAFYKAMVARASQLVTVSEAGSTRAIGDIYRNAMDLLKYWQGESDKEDKEAINFQTPKRYVMSRKMRRV